MSVTSDRATIKRDMWAVNASMSPVCTAVSLILLLIGEVRNSNGQYRDDEITSLQTLLSSVNNNKRIVFPEIFYSTFYPKVLCISLSKSKNVILFRCSDFFPTYQNVYKECGSMTKLKIIFKSSLSTSGGNDNFSFL